MEFHIALHQGITEYIHLNGSYPTTISLAVSTARDLVRIRKADWDRENLQWAVTHAGVKFKIRIDNSVPISSGQFIR